MHKTTIISDLTNQQLLKAFAGLSASEKRAKAEGLKFLGEIDSRRLYLSQGYNSLFNFLVKGHGLAEGTASKRVQACRLVRRFPLITKLIEQGSIHMTALSMLAPILTEENHKELLEKAKNLPKRKLEYLICQYRPKPELKDNIKPITSQPDDEGNATKTQNTESIHSEINQSDLNNLFLNENKQSNKGEQKREWDKIKPVAESRCTFSFTGSRELEEKMERAKEILRHKFPKGKLEDILDEALEALLDKKDPDRKLERKKKREEEKAARLEKPEKSDNKKHTFSSQLKKILSNSRYIPQYVKMHVWERDGGCCTFTSKDGVRCGSKSFLEYDHLRPYRLGGKSDDPANIRLLCSFHNKERSERTFGIKFRNERTFAKEAKGLSTG